MFLTENKKTDADTGECHTGSITDTSSVNSNNGAGSLTTGGWWCELKREREQQYETDVSYPTEVIVNSNRPRVFIYRLTSTTTESAASKYQF